MKLKISGKEYDLTLGFKKATLQTLYVLNKDYGVSVKDLEEAGNKFEGKDLMEIVSDTELLRALMAMIWMARRYAGEDVTLDESSSFPISELEPIGTEPAAEADPKGLTGSEAAAAAPAAVAGSSSETSKRRSTRTSSK